MLTVRTFIKMIKHYFFFFNETLPIVWIVLGPRPVVTAANKNASKKRKDAAITCKWPNQSSIKILFAFPKLNSNIAYSASNLGSKIDAAWGYTGATRKNSRSCKRRMIFLLKNHIWNALINVMSSYYQLTDSVLVCNIFPLQPSLMFQAGSKLE